MGEANVYDGFLIPMWEPVILRFATEDPELHPPGPLKDAYTYRLAQRLVEIGEFTAVDHYKWRLRYPKGNRQPMEPAPFFDYVKLHVYDPEGKKTWLADATLAGGKYVMWLRNWREEVR